MNGTLRNQSVEFVRGYIGYMEDDNGTKLFRAFVPKMKYLCEILAKSSKGYNIKFRGGWTYQIPSDLIEFYENSE